MLLLPRQHRSCASVSRMWFKASVKADSRRTSLTVQSTDVLVSGLDAVIYGDRFSSLVKFEIECIGSLLETRKLAESFAHLPRLQTLHLTFSSSEPHVIRVLFMFVLLSLR